MTSKQNGFGIVPIIVIVAVLCAAGLIVWRILSPDAKTPVQIVVGDTQSQSQQPVATDLYQGWKTYTLQYEKFSFRYPDSLTLADTSATDPDKYIEPGMDHIKLTKSDGFELSIQTGVDGIGGACEDCRVISTRPIQFLGQPASFNYVDNDKTGTVSGITVTKKSDDWFGVGLLGRNVKFTNSGKVLPMGIYIHYVEKGDLVHKDLATLKVSKDISDALKILESASY